MGNIEVFNDERFGQIRVSGTSDEPMFCLTDICRVLDLHVGMTRQRLDPKGVSLIDTPTNGGVQALIYVNEKNLYKVIMRSDKPQAEPFQDWVCGEVLPSIRKTGSYSLHQKLPQTYLEALKQLVAIEEERQKLALENHKQAEQIKIDMPRVLFSKAVETSKRSCLVAELAKILQQNGKKIGQNRLFKWMRDNNYLCSKGQYHNQPTQKAMDMGLFEIKQTVINKPDGCIMVKSITKVTGKGQVYFVNKILKQKIEEI